MAILIEAKFEIGDLETISNYATHAVGINGFTDFERLLPYRCRVYAGMKQHKKAMRDFVDVQVIISDLWEEPHAMSMEKAVKDELRKFEAQVSPHPVQSHKAFEELSSVVDSDLAYLHATLRRIYGQDRPHVLFAYDMNTCYGIDDYDPVVRGPDMIQWGPG